MESIRNGKTVGFIPSDRHSEKTPFDDMIDEDVRIEAGGNIGGLGKLVSADFYQGGYVFVLYPHVYTGPGIVERRPSKTIITSPIYPVSVTKEDLDYFIEEMNLSRSRNGKKSDQSQ
jgi:hypothetical protein